MNNNLEPNKFNPTNSVDNSSNKNNNLNNQKPKKKKYWIPILIVSICIIVFIIFPIIFINWISSNFKTTPTKIEDNSILYLDLSNIEEYSNSFSFTNIINQYHPSNFLDILNCIKEAKTDNRIKGIYFECLMGTNIPDVKASELQSALVDFKKSGKFIYSYIENGNEDDYFNALPSDSIFVCSESLIEFNGFGAASLFPKGLYDKLGVEFEVVQCEDFKSYGEVYKNKKFSDSARYQQKIIIEQKENSFIKAVEKFRKIPQEKTLEYFNSVFYSAKELVEKKLVDVIISQDEIKELMYKKIFNKSSKNNKSILFKDFEENNIVTINKYIENIKQNQPKNNNLKNNNDDGIAIIYGCGEILAQSKNNFIQDEQAIIANKFIDNLKEARENKNIKGILLRIDSPGGSVIASEAIYQEILKTRKIKPVYASMSDVAASGGYYISMACDTIIAHPKTITGSIGVIMAIPNYNKALNKLDINIDTISSGHGNPFGITSVLPIDNDSKEKLKKFGFDTYFRFLSKAAKARNKTVEEMRKIAKGRVWTGQDAYKIGLVDVLGGFDTALDLLKKRTGLKNKKDVKLYIYPKKNNFTDMLFSLETFGKMSLTWLKFDSKLNMNTSNIDYKPLLSQMIDKDIQNSILYNINLINLLQQEKVLVSLPYYIKIK